MNSTRQVLATVESFIAEIGGVKSAEAHTEAGSIGGPTTHPVKNVEDGTQTATEGSRSKENTQDIKKDIGKPSVDSTAVKGAGAHVQTGIGDTSAGKEDQLQIGTKKGPTGSDVPPTKSTKDDPGSSHPARTDNNQLNGGKYASDLANDPLEKLAAEIGRVGNDLLAAITSEIGANKQASTATATTATQPQAKVAGVADTAEPGIDFELARLLGWDTAALLTGQLDKQAADRMVEVALAETIKQAEDDAQRTAEYLSNYFAARKQAAEGEGPSMTDGGGAPELPPDASGGAGAGGSSASAPGGADGGADAQQLMQVLQQLGITPQQVIQGLMQGGGAGGPPPGGDPTGGAGAPTPPPGGGMQVSASDKGVTSEKVADYVREVISRSRVAKAAAVQRR